MKKYFTQQGLVIYSLLTLCSYDLQAALPTPVAPSNAHTAGNWLELIKGYSKDAGFIPSLF